MHISSITQQTNPLNDGLAPLALRGLRRIVVLAGANGSGKSRLLRRITTGLHPSHRSQQYGAGFVIENPITTPAVEFVSKNLTLTDSSTQAPQSVVKFALQAETLGAANLANSTLSYIQRAQTHWWDSSHQNSPEPEAIREEKKKQYESLCALVQTVLGEPLIRDADGIATLFGKTIATAALSDGQRALLQWCVALHAQDAKLGDQILTMDEPENHLHAESLVSSVERIATANTNGQVWIATHSVPLIASLYKNHTDELSVYYMHKGQASFASERPEVVLYSLMGGEENIESLREFIDLPEVFATNRFAAQCLQSPDVVADDNPNDPQVLIAGTAVADNGVPTKLLDYGCGKGRFLASLWSLHDSDLPNRIDYVGWDRDATNRTACEHVINNAYGDGNGRWYCDRNTLMQHRPAGHFDCVLLCNVLHEIPPNAWADTFNVGGVINQSLADDGNLLVIEDYLMPKGEYAHPFGFVVLDTEALQKLFGAGNGNDSILVHSERDGRIKGHVVPKHLLTNVTHNTVRESLLIAQRNAKEKIEALRANGTPDFKSGRAHGFWVQQYANTSLALS